MSARVLAVIVMVAVGGLLFACWSADRPVEQTSWLNGGSTVEVHTWMHNATVVRNGDEVGVSFPKRGTIWYIQGDATLDSQGHLVSRPVKQVKIVKESYFWHPSRQ